MKFLTIFTLFLIAVIYVKCEPFSQEPDYYWRDYLGRIPEDALLGGYDKSGNPTYLAQTYNSPNAVVPAYTTKGNKFVLATVGDKKIKGELYSKILCTPNPCRYKWILTNPTDVGKLESKYTLVSAGYHLTVNDALYFGRVNFDMELRVGTFIKDKTPRFETLFQNGKRAFNSFEILVYDYNNPECVIPSKTKS